MRRSGRAKQKSVAPRKLCSVRRRERTTWVRIYHCRVAAYLNRRLQATRMKPRAPEPGRSPMQQTYDTARQILDIMQRTYQAPIEIVSASEADFNHLNLSAYTAFRLWFEGQSLRHMADLELPALSRDPKTCMARCMIRAHLSADGTIGAGYYQCKPRIYRVVRQLIIGLLNFRWVAAPTWAIKTLRTRHCVDFKTELDDGTFVVTSNAETAALLSSPPSVDSAFFQFNTAPLTLLEAHKQRVQSKLASLPGRQAIVVKDLAGLQQQYRRSIEQKRAYRATLDWISRAELASMANNRELADEVYAELRKLLSESE